MALLKSVTEEDVEAVRMTGHKPVNTKKLAEALDVTEDTIRKHAKAGNIPAMRIGRHFRYDPEKVALALSNSAKQQQKPASK